MSKDQSNIWLSHEVTTKPLAATFWLYLNFALWTLIFEKSAPLILMRFQPILTHANTRFHRHA